MVDIKCKYCGKTFSVSKYRKDTAKYCSRDCKDKSLIGKEPPNKSVWPILICEYCNERYSVPPNQAKRSRFCSRLCQNRWIGANRKRFGQDNPMFKNGSGAKYYRR